MHSKVMESDYCSQTWVAFWTKRRVKGFLPFNPFAFTHVPPDVTTSKLCEDLMFGKSVWHCVYKIYGLFWWRNLRLSVMLWTFFSHGNLRLFYEFFSWSAKVSKPLSLSDQSL
jgi:hypothetical protein